VRIADKLLVLSSNYSSFFLRRSRWQPRSFWGLSARDAPDMPALRPDVPFRPGWLRCARSGEPRCIESRRRRRLFPWSGPIRL